MGNRKKNSGTPIDGIVLLDKPQGISSNKALQITKRLFNARKAGHTGSLDPLATGVLPICFGHGTKISEMFLNSDKRYEVGIKLGICTDSGDSEGTILSTRDVSYSAEQLENVIQSFEGEIQQIPPMFSALKKDGQPLYKLARKGIEVKREPRSVTVYDINYHVTAHDYLQLSVHCSKGFYIRSLAMDIGDALNCGAHVDTLRRTTVSNFEIDQCVSLEQLEVLQSPEVRQNLIIPIDQTLSHLPEIDLPQNQAQLFCHGQSIRALTPLKSGLTRIYSESQTVFRIRGSYERRRDST